MGYPIPSEVDRVFLVEALCAAGEQFLTLAKQSSDAQIHEDYELKRDRCLRLVLDLDADT
jgi:hypothetical protein